jgi:fused signal recognition particle receptor
MDGAISPDLIAALVALGTLAGTGAFGYALVRRARAARRRQIESAGEARAAAAPARRPALPELDEPEGDLDEAESDAEEIEERPSTGVTPGGPSRRDEPARPEARSDARILPFPLPPPPTAAPAMPTTRPVEKPRPAPALRPVKETEPATAPAKLKDGAALRPGLARTRSSWVARLGQVFAGRKEIDRALIDEIEKVLLTADIGVRTTQKLLEELRNSLDKNELKDPQAIWSFLRQRSVELLTVGAPPVDVRTSQPFVILVIGVNGSGKTTTIGKLAAQLKAANHRVLLAAGDTFRAAATEQLEVWGARVEAPVVRGKEGADPSSVLFDAVKRGRAEVFDVVIADTAGRLHTKTNLMEELKKVRRVIGKAHEGAPHETWLVIDSTSGQNAIAQAQIFTQAMSVTGIVLTKLDGTAKGGVILGIADQLRLPVRYIGVGERVEDLREFDAKEFVEALFDEHA